MDKKVKTFDNFAERLKHLINNDKKCSHYLDQLTKDKGSFRHELVSTSEKIKIIITKN